MDHSPINQNFELNKSRQNNYDFYTIDLIEPIVRQWHFAITHRNGNHFPFVI